MRFRHLIYVYIFYSAGVGRSGTYITLDRLLQLYDKAQSDDAAIDVFAIVYEMRKYRVWMVQTEVRHVFISLSPAQYSLNSAES